MTLKIVSVGPGDPSLLNAKTINTLRSAGKLFLCTGRHPLASWLNTQKIPFSTMDDLYDSSEDFEKLSEALASRLWNFASQCENTVYAVSDSMTDHSVDVIFSSRPSDSRIDLLPGFSFADYYLPSCRFFFSTADIRICSASSFIESCYDPSLPVLITELNDEITAGEVKQFLSSLIRDEETVVFLNGNADANPIPLYELDRQPAYDHLSAVAAGPFSYSHRCKKTLNDLVSIMDHLRSAEGCPWDRAQTHESLIPYVIEEAWEVVAAIRENHPVHLAEELGDLLFQIVFHASIGKSFDEFSIDDVLELICEKMIRRHPHVFLKKGTSGSSDIASQWESIKREETGHLSIADSLSDVSPSLPALIYAEKVLKKMKQSPFLIRSDADILSDLQERFSSMSASKDLNEIKQHIGSILFLCSEISQLHHFDTEILLHDVVQDSIHSFSVNDAAPPEKRPDA